MYLRHQIEKVSGNQVTIDTANNDVLGLSLELRSKLEATDSLRPKKFVVDSDGRIWFVKMVQEEQGQREISINRILREHVRNKGFTAFITSEYEWIGKFTQGSNNTCFLAFPYIKGRTLNQIINFDDQKFKLTDEDILLGLIHLLDAFAATSPEFSLISSPTQVKFWHRDLKTDQVIVEESSKVFYLVDFGISQIELLENYQKLIIESSSSVTYQEDLGKILDPLCKLIENQELKVALNDEIKKFLQFKIQITELSRIIKEYLKKYYDNS